MANPIEIAKKSFVRRTNSENALFEYGKLPPQEKELEEAVLGAVLIERDCIEDIISFVKEDVFYVDAHQRIWRAIDALYAKNAPIDLLTVTSQLKENGDLDSAGGAFYVAQLTNKIGSASNAEYHARLIYEAYIKRQTIAISTESIKDAYDDTNDAFEVLEKAEKNLSLLSENKFGNEGQTIGHSMRQELNLIEARMSMEENELTGVTSGFYELDALLGGWQKSDLIIVAGRPSMGKCLKKWTPIIMYDGSVKNVEDIVVGDLLMGIDSTPRKVMSLARGREMMYWVRQRFAMDYCVNESHILSLKRSRNEGKYKHGDVLNMELKEYIGKSNKFKSNYKGWKTGIDFAEKQLPIEPYFLGIWLGDGRLKTQRISKPDIEIRDYVKWYADKLGMRFSESDEKCPVYNIARIDRNSNPLLDKMRLLNIVDNKHIPSDFLINSNKNRLELLAGLLDTDGHYNAEFNVYEITMVDEKLMNQIKYLCDTLGFRTTLKPKKASIKSIGYECVAYRLRIYGNLEIIPCKIERKKARPYRSIRSWQHTSFKIEKDKVDDYYGFTLDQDGLFLLGDGTVTHNTACTLNFARHAAIMGKKSVAVFSLEMSTAQLTQRLISGEAEIANDRIRNGKLNDGEWSRLTSSLDYLASANIVIDDTPALSIMELKAKARRLKKDHNIEMIVIDYIQLMSGSGKGDGNREQEISAISRGLKAIAKELNIPVIALSQLSRAVETRGGEKKPILSDLRESGSIEQDADIVIFLYRPEYYGFEQDTEGNSNAGIGYFMVSKHRNGGLKDIRVGFDGKYTKFKNLVDGGGVTIENHTQQSENSGSSINNSLNKKYIDKRREEQREKKASGGNTSIQNSADDYDSETPF